MVPGSPHFKPGGPMVPGFNSANSSRLTPSLCQRTNGSRLTSPAFSRVNSSRLTPSLCWWGDGSWFTPSVSWHTQFSSSSLWWTSTWLPSSRCDSLKFSTHGYWRTSSHARRIAAFQSNVRVSPSTNLCPISR
ncbi:hypothetical protein EB796_022870 [Bugula neritina]|uniref:Uncharacterized protein n=1 Tax=Bugula neritina TaxID=10212 RepID=A0A7J7IZH2_BUGNE|nr:hypothetical protein EB796_022870 [Bugula neritina]